MIYRFHLRRAYFLSGYASSYEELKKIGEGDVGPGREKAAGALPLVKAVPMMLRRRLNPAGRMAVGIAMACAAEYRPDKVIFASRTGQTLRCIRLLKDVAAGRAVSPMEFSSSVHNADIGVFSIIAGFHGETTAVSAGERTLGEAMAEACASLYGQNLGRALALVCEENLANEIMPIPESVYGSGAFAGGLVLEKCRGADGDPGLPECNFAFDDARDGGANPVAFLRALSFRNGDEDPAPEA